jgi:transposase InsO family protein
MIAKAAEERLKILLFWQRHGLGATQEAFKVSRRTLYLWQAQLVKRASKPHALAPRSTRPKQVRHRQWPPAISREIRRLRNLHPNLGKEKLYPFLRSFCQAQGMRCPSVRTIGRLIANSPDKMRCVPYRPSARFGKRLSRVKRTCKPKRFVACTPGDCLAWDSIHRVRDGIHRYLITCTDLNSRFGCAVAVKHLSSARARLAWELSQCLFPFPVKRVLTDNGAEFAKHFHQAVCTQGLLHWHTYPKTPKTNAHCERFNRTIQDEFVDYHEDLLFSDLLGFNNKLLGWLLWYNTQRPHHSLKLQTPADILAQHLNHQCKMYWPNTRT